MQRVFVFFCSVLFASLFTPDSQRFELLGQSSPRGVHDRADELTEVGDAQGRACVASIGDLHGSDSTRWVDALWSAAHSQNLPLSAVRATHASPLCQRTERCNTPINSTPPSETRRGADKSTSLRRLFLHSLSASQLYPPACSLARIVRSGDWLCDHARRKRGHGRHGRRYRVSRPVCDAVVLN